MATLTNTDEIAQNASPLTSAVANPNAAPTTTLSASTTNALVPTTGAGQEGTRDETTISSRRNSKRVEKEGATSPVSNSTEESATPTAVEEADGRPTIMGRRLWILISGLLASSSTLALDQAIVVTALPALSSEFNALAQLPWVVNGFFLTQATGTIAFGQLYTLYPAKWTFMLSVFIFEIGSLISAVAPSFWLLILGRAITGWGGGGLVVGMHTIIGQVVRLKDRSIHYSSLGAVFTAASIGGPLLGGVFTDTIGWRWCFWINLPVGAIGAAAVFFALPFYPVRLSASLKGKGQLAKLKAIDWVGNILALGATVSLVLPLQWGGYIKHWSDPTIISLFVVCGVLFGMFICWELWIASRGHAVVPLRMLANRSVNGAAASGFFLNIVFGVCVTYLPLLYQSRGSSALRSGIEILPLMISSVVVLVVSGICVKRLGYYKPWIVIGPLIAAIGAGCLTNADLLTRNDLIGWQILIGVGFGVAFQNTIMVIQAEYANQPWMIPQGASITGFFQRLGPMVGIAIAGAVFINSIDHQLRPHPFGLSDDQIMQVRHSVTAIFDSNNGLTEPQKQAVTSIYIEAIRRAWIILAPAAILAGLTAGVVKNWDVRARGLEAAAATRGEKSPERNMEMREKPPRVMEEGPRTSIEDRSEETRISISQEQGDTRIFKPKRASDVAKGALDRIERRA